MIQSLSFPQHISISEHDLFSTKYSGIAFFGDVLFAENIRLSVPNKLELWRQKSKYQRFCLAAVKRSI